MSVQQLASCTGMTPGQDGYHWLLLWCPPCANTPCCTGPTTPSALLVYVEKVTVLQAAEPLVSPEPDRYRTAEKAKLAKDRCISQDGSSVGCLCDYAQS